MTNRSSKQWSARILSCLFLLTTISAVEIFHQKQIAFLKNESFSEAQKQLSIVRSRIEAVIVTDMYLLNGMSTQVAIAPQGSTQEWNKIADSIIQDGSHIQLIGLAQNDVLSFVYPREGNESILGIDYRDHPEQWFSVVQARKIGKTFISGPVELFQGGWALITRTPIFMDPPFNQEYWGVSSAVISLESILKDAGAAQLENRYQFAIRGFNSAGKDGAVFYGSETVFNNAFATEMANFPYGGWFLALAGDDNVLMDVPWIRVHIVRIIGYTLLLLLSLAYFMIYRLYTIAHGRSMHDELTMLPNRRYFMYSLKMAFKNAQRNGSEHFAVMNIDLDGFKSINDTYGHAAGDKVLVEVAKRIRGVLRSSDIVARMGGDEFLILLPRVHDDQHLLSIRSKLERDICLRPVQFDGREISLDVSIGWVAYTEVYRDVDELLKAADEKMYQRKRAS
ncbi:sensor domain-containing diguanylate cyclase [Vibrio sp. D404a]|uniref:diguanylate cyclase domain-containing protein n=1 Tax=unclassified Vibrio TaxID=2614977 RepID=UPI0025531549|nr:MULTISPECIES: diguanylate cyclase [unclassified Vibrio]MDK9736932.1 sensor domain-containing diguanylate cyclase [Vibrio sp. D404a]MDK9798079.1 sensor domain-containing diguanylate cyclase [Vibrio sp. D449a]